MICGKTVQKINEIKNKLSIKYLIKDLGEGKTYVETNINYDYKDFEMSIDHRDIRLESMILKIVNYLEHLYNKSKA